MTASDYGDIVAALRAVPGVTDADVEPDDDGEGLGLLRLGLDPGVDEVAVATNVGRLLRERFGLGVDADRVELVEDAESLVPEQTSPAAAPDARPRPAIERMHLVSSGLDVTASVTLRLGERTGVGEATGTATQTGVQRAVASATARAVEQLVTGRLRIELEHIETTAAGPVRTVVVTVTMLSGTGSERLTGAAGIRDDARQAVIRATLDALNRRLEPLLS